MHYRAGRNRDSTSLLFNATPMIDVIFMLTVFFMLVSRFSSEENVHMELPDPIASQAKEVKVPNRLVVNCRVAGPLNDPGAEVAYSIGANRPTPLARLSEQLAGYKQAKPTVKVVVRADKRLRYDDIKPVMRVIADNNIELLNVIAKVARE